MLQLVDRPEPGEEKHNHHCAICERTYVCDYEAGVTPTCIAGTSSLCSPCATAGYGATLKPGTARVQTHTAVHKGDVIVAGRQDAQSFGSALMGAVRKGDPVGIALHDAKAGELVGISLQSGDPQLRAQRRKFPKIFGDQDDE